MTIRASTTLPAAPVVQRAVPAAAGTVTITANSGGDILVVLEPAGTLATLTTTLPVAAFDGQRVTVLSTQVLTLLTLNSAAGSVSSAITTLAANTAATYVWVTSQTKWYRCA